MCLNAILSLEESMKMPLNTKTTKILDFCCGSESLGQLLHERGFKEIHGIEGS